MTEKQLDFCPWCSDSVLPETGVMYLGGRWHPACRDNVREQRRLARKLLNDR